jgi:hypothetical protein
MFSTAPVGKAGPFPSTMTKPSTASATKSRTCCSSPLKGCSALRPWQIGRPIIRAGQPASTVPEFSQSITSSMLLTAAYF